MKIWVKYLVALAVGLAFGAVVPIADGVLSVMLELAINLSRYALVPLVLFSVPIAAHELHEDRKLLRLSLRVIGYSMAAVLALTLLGTAGAFVLSPGRIPLSSEAQYVPPMLPTLGQVLSALVPPNPLAALVSGDYLLPLAALALILGLAFSFDHLATKPTVTLFDSLSRISWQINNFLVEFLPLPMLFAAAARMAALGQVSQFGQYARLVTAVAIEAVFVALVLLPAVIFATNGRKNPFPTVYGLLGPSLAALATAHLYAPGGALAKHLKDNLGVRRRAGALSLPLAYAFGRAGTAMVSATAFIVILNSYSSLGLSSGTLLWMLAWVPFSTLLVGAAPAAGAASILAFMCAAYGRGFETGYILVLPAALPLLAIGTFLDTLVAGCLVSMSSQAERYVTQRDHRHFI